MVKKIMGAIIKVNEFKTNWDFIFVGKVVGEKEDDKEKFSIFLEKNIVQNLFENHIYDFKILKINVGDTSGMGMIVLDSGNTLLAGANTIAKLAEDLVLKKDVDKYTFKEKVALLSKALTGKELFISVTPKKGVLSTDAFEKTPITIIIHN